MKTKLLFAAILSIIFISCQKEVSYEQGTSGGGTGGSGGGGGTGGSAECKSCAYIPMCDGSWYTYNDTLLGTAQIASDTLRYVKDTTISSLTFKKFYSPGAQNNTYTSCNNGVSRIITYNPVSLGGNTVSVIDLTLLKANLPVNGSWVDYVTNPTGQQVQYADTIKEKAVSRVVNGVTYNDVIHVYVATGLDVPIIGFIVTNATDYYYAKGVGLIEALIVDPNSGIVLQHRALKSYYIP